MTLNPHAPIFKPTTSSRLFTIYRPDLLTKMEASTSQDTIDLPIPIKCLKTSPDSDSPTVSEQLHLLTSQVNQLRIDSQQALDQTKPFIQSFPLANIKQFHYLHAVQQQVAQFFVDLNAEKNERLQLHATIRRLEEELTLLRRQINEPSTSSLPVPFTVDPPSSAASQDSNILGSIQILKPRVSITLKRPSSTQSRSQPTEQPRASQSNQTTSGPFLDLETRVRQLEEEITKAREGRETIASIHRSQFAFLYDRIRALESGGSDTILWKLTAFRLVLTPPNLPHGLTMRPRTPALIITVLCTVHTLMATTSLFSSTLMVWTLPLEITLQLCSLYSLATMMVYWHGRSPKRSISQFAINSTPRTSGLLPSHPPRRHPFEGLPENHILPWRTSTSSHTARCSAKLKTFF